MCKSHKKLQKLSISSDCPLDINLCCFLTFTAHFSFKMVRPTRQNSHLKKLQAEKRNLAISETKSTSDGGLEAENEKLREKIQ